MSFKLNLEKSIKYEFIIYKLNFEYVLELFFETFVYVGWTFLLVSILSNPDNNENVFFTLCLIFFTIFLLISWFLNYKMLKVEISNPKIDREKIVELLKKEFPDFLLNDNGINILRGKYRGGIFSSGKKIFVIFTEDKILLNLTTYGRGESNIPFYSIINHRKLIKIRKDFMKNKKIL
ncbi:hypothetical protein K5V07_07145 [Flavobacterium sp. CHNK8]|jgi:hypothetical protein|uniref:hypothetical protein n=1 Tax=Flavobacterium sp. CHNK8 TaxID=2871165 RepID=UPI001C8E8F92|nr:hypothetical protein [Flavobacterium sp. CHNK8]QZK90282.1 hypothetical protein K5V07_07145 [Flavobacterium sp. CHNK8]